MQYSTPLQGKKTFSIIKFSTKNKTIIFNISCKVFLLYLKGFLPIYNRYDY